MKKLAKTWKIKLLAISKVSYYSLQSVCVITRQNVSFQRVNSQRKIQWYFHENFCLLWENGSKIEAFIYDHALIHRTKIHNILCRCDVKMVLCNSNYAEHPVRLSIFATIICLLRWLPCKTVRRQDKVPVVIFMWQLFSISSLLFSSLSDNR